MNTNSLSECYSIELKVLLKFNRNTKDFFLSDASDIEQLIAYVTKTPIG